MIFDSWVSLGRILVTAPLAYVALVAILRISGKRTLTKLSAFDFIVTIALGSILGTVTLNNSVALADGVLALALLVFFQFAISWLAVRVSWVRGLVKGEPTLLMHDGAFLPDALRAQRITRNEAISALRASGLHDFSEVKAVILETDGSLNVLRGQDADVEAHTLDDVNGPRVAPAGRGA